MRNLIFATVLGATMTLSTQAATPRSEYKNQYEQGRKNPDYNRNERENRGHADEYKKSDYRDDRWKNEERGERRGYERFRGDRKHHHNFKKDCGKHNRGCNGHR